VPASRAVDVPIVVVGAGPVGLFMAVRLRAAGIETVVVERRPERTPGSRAIGVHPPSVRAFDELGMGAALRQHAVRIQRARARGADGELAALDLAAAGEVLSLPQRCTEALLEARLEALGGRVERGLELVELRQDPLGVDVGLRGRGGDIGVRAAVVVSCDGRASRVRELLGIGGWGGRYPDRYLMADVPGETGAADEATITLHPDGVVERFPLPGAERWVVHAGTSVPDEPERRSALLRAAVAQRTGTTLAAERPVAASAFGIERFVAERFVRGRVALAGDAAHAVSPIGGQGMNLGWLDALALGPAVEALLDGAAPATVLGRYERHRRRRAREAVWRAELNTRLGRPMTPAQARWRDMALRVALRRPLRGLLIGAFTMRGLT
jgi:2-polyprenyl-6-methoxyphenol hydroxylase-like FAD-dependent oxidoreductase